MQITTTATANATINTIRLIIVVTVLLVIALGVTMIVVMTVEEVLQCGSITVPHATEILITIISI